MEWGSRCLLLNVSYSLRVTEKLKFANDAKEFAKLTGKQIIYLI